MEDKEKPAYRSHADQYKRTFFSVEVASRWLLVEECTCGTVHRYWVLEKEPEDPLVPKKLLSQFSDEWRKHFTERMKLKV